ncbi:BRCA1-associated RING domain protein 1 [Podila verticillata]|nr:BRCA1-associated RING domain protein 1 [Podila verticillata]
MRSLLKCSLCQKELKFTQSLRECGHHFCYDCIYPVLGPTGICPTCRTKAIVGNMLDLTSYDVLLACIDKLAALRMNQAQGSGSSQAPTISQVPIPSQVPLASQAPSSPQQAPGREETPMGTVIWTYDCGPTLPSPLCLDQLSETSSSASLPSLNTALTTHNRELISRTQNQKEQGKATIMYPSEDAPAPRETRQQLSEEAMPPPSRPTMRQLKQLLDMQDPEPDAVPNSQEHETQTQTLSIHHNLSQHSDTEPLNTLSAPIHAYQSSIDTFQFSDNDASLFETYTTAVAKNKRKTSVDHTHYTTPAPDQKRRQNRAQPRELATPPPPLPPPPPHPQDLKEKGKAAETHFQHADKIRARSMTPGRKQEAHYQLAGKIRSRSTTPSIRRNALIGSRNPRGHRRILLPQSRSGSETVPTSEDEDEVEVVLETRRKSDGEVQTSQPTMDEAMPSLFIRDIRWRSESRSRSRESRSEVEDPSQLLESEQRPERLDSKPSCPEEPPILVSCIFTGLSAKASSEFDSNTTRLVEAGLLMEHIPNQDSSDSCTHIVTSAEPYTRSGGSHMFELCPRKLKYLFGLLSPAWIVCHEWFTDSIEQKRWLPLSVDSKYLVQGDTHFGPAPGTTARRQIRHKSGQRLFESCRMYFYGDFPQTQAFKRLELQRLVQHGGATILSRRPKTSSSSSSQSSKGDPLTDNTTFAPERSFLYLSEDTKPWQAAIDRHRPIVVCDPSYVLSDVAQLSVADLRKHGWLRDFQAVSVTWVLDCISCSLMGDRDLESLSLGNDGGDMQKTRNQIRELDEAWRHWHQDEIQ